MSGGITATATHDTKRGEDARARIVTLSELAGEWHSAVAQWRELNASLARVVGAKRSPSLGHEYMIYQALIGAWPQAIDGVFVKRMQDYALKAAREAKQETSWTNVDEAYEAGLLDFVGKLLDRGASARFLASFEAFAARAALLGALNSLSQLALKALLPGVPDFYQGDELWDLSLVDPDNRRPVDFALRERLLREPPADWRELAKEWRDGRIKLALTRQLLRVRHGFPDLFQHGAYEPLPVSGAHAGHVIAFARTLKKRRIIVAVGRHFAPLTGGGRRWASGWTGSIEHRAARYESLIGDGGRVDDLNLATLFRDIPVAVLRQM
jgi:(1->4)-alpha-D-glucan 1-alpha-D-glucosylmutase